MSQSSEAWQEVNCPQHDYDLFGSDMVYEGEEFHCLACGGRHVAASGMVETFIDSGGVISYPSLPKSPDELRVLLNAANKHSAVD